MVPIGWFGPIGWTLVIPRREKTRPQRAISPVACRVRTTWRSPVRGFLPYTSRATAKPPTAGREMFTCEIERHDIHSFVRKCRADVVRPSVVDCMELWVRVTFLAPTLVAYCTNDTRAPSPPHACIMFSSTVERRVDARHAGGGNGDSLTSHNQCPTNICPDQQLDQQFFVGPLLVVKKLLPTVDQ